VTPPSVEEKEEEAEPAPLLVEEYHPPSLSEEEALDGP
jgi:hypothetical protein